LLEVRVEELLLTQRRWADEATGPEEDGWTPPGPLAGAGREAQRLASGGLHSSGLR